jgi:P2-related tail formation protein
MNNINYTECLKDHFREESCSYKPLTISDNPTIIDKILFRFKTTKSGSNCDYCCSDLEDNYCEDDCLDPFTFDSITIYYIERNFSNKNTYASEDSVFHYSDAVVVYKIGVPLWTNNTLDCPPFNAKGNPSNYEFCQKISCPDPKDQISYKRTSKDEQDQDNLLLKKIDGKTGCFEFVWTPEGVREGDYFICWTYTPYKGSASISNHQKFYLGSSTAINTSTLIHRTNPNKYLDLLERYTPEMFKTHIADVDLTPSVIEKLNKSVAKGFNVLEDLTNQLVDLLDSNSVNEYIIYYLSNTLNLNLKSRDPILWRRQIKEAIPLFKKKGTLPSLKQAFEQAGMKLIRVLNYWQIVSPYYFIDSFELSSNNAFNLSKKMVGTEIKITKYTQKSNTVVSGDKFSLVQEDFITKLIFVDDNHEDNSFIKVEYFYNLPKNDFENDIFEYIQNLPLMDNREPFLNGKYIIPLKNWNTKLIEENDPFVDHIIKTRHPFAEQVVFGKIKTEFPYSENIYNMEEYNGSIRDSKNPCDIDKDFLDSCFSCRSSNFDVDLEIEDLCDDRIIEASQIVSENTPFHSVLRTINYFGGNNEYFITPLENYEILINYKYSEKSISGGLQRWFHRSRLKDDLYNRDELSSKFLSFSGDVSFYNEKVSLFCSDLDFNILDNSNSNFIEILSPSIHSGVHSVYNPKANFIDVEDIVFLNNSMFVFNLYSELDFFTTDLVRDDYVKLIEEDSSISFTSIGIDDSCQVLIDGDFYDIKQVYENEIILNNNGNKINKSFSNTYKIFDKNQQELQLKINKNSSTCKIEYSNLTKVIKKLNIENKKYYDLKLSFNKNDVFYSCDVVNYNSEYFYIKGYFGEDTGGLEVKLLNYFAKGQAGNFSYSGVRGFFQGNLDEDFLNNYNDYSIKVANGNFLNNYYFISDIEQNNSGYTFDLHGDFENFGLFENKAQSFCEFYKYRNNNMTIQEQNRELDQIDMEINRNNSIVIQKNIEIKCEGKTNSDNENQVLSSSSNNVGPVETSIQKENIFVIIKDVNGEEKEVNL